MALHEKTAQVRPPGIASPPQNLLQEAPIGFHRRKKLRLGATLHIGAPTVRDHPPCKELIVTRVQLVLSQPVVVCEAVQKFGVLEDDSPVGSRSPRQAWDTAVDMTGGGDFDVANGKAECGKNFPDRHRLPHWLNALACTNASNLLVLETGQDRGKQGRGPNGVVVGEEDDVGGGVFDTVAHLKTLVGEWYRQDAYPLWVDLVGKVLEGAKHLLFGDDEDFLGLADEPTVGGFLELLPCINGGHNDGDIFGGDVCRVFGERDWLVCDRGGDTNQVPQVAIESGRKMSAKCANGRVEERAPNDAEWYNCGK